MTKGKAPKASRRRVPHDPTVPGIQRTAPRLPHQPSPWTMEQWQAHIAEQGASVDRRVRDRFIAALNDFISESKHSAQYEQLRQLFVDIVVSTQPGDDNATMVGGIRSALQRSIVPLAKAGQAKTKAVKREPELRIVRDALDLLKPAVRRSSGRFGAVKRVLERREPPVKFGDQKLRGLIAEIEGTLK